MFPDIFLEISRKRDRSRGVRIFVQIDGSRTLRARDGKSLQKAASNYAADQSRLNIAEQIIGKKMAHCKWLGQWKRGRAIQNVCRSNGRGWNRVILTRVRSHPRISRTRFPTPWIGNSTCARRHCRTYGFRHLRGPTVKDQKSYDVGVLSGNARVGGTKGAYFTPAWERKEAPRRARSPRSFISREKPPSCAGWVKGRRRSWCGRKGEGGVMGMWECVFRTRVHPRSDRQTAVAAG